MASEEASSIVVVGSPTMRSISPPYRDRQRFDALVFRFSSGILLLDIIDGEVFFH
ncbi:unnamed protein product [Arabis nemorensis]|uniref:Uncharacterized protein n=1 Tax=Arabis nemorensis TaxID=586526 RepID=A0A565CPD4_9BRAS|nr:unnamed protein product [Arabis nemorensis]